MQPRQFAGATAALLAALIFSPVGVAGNKKICHTIFHDADELDKVRKLIEKSGEIDAIHCDKYDTPLLHRAAQFADDERALEMLLDAGADIEIRGPFNFTPLMEAVRSWDQHRKAERIRVLLGRGADVHATRGDATVLHFAAEEAETVEIVDMLIAAGARVEDASGAEAVLRLAAENDSAAVREHIEQLVEPMMREAALQERIDKLWTSGADIPPDVRRDKEMVALTGHLKSERFWEALAHFEILRRLDVPLDSSFDFYHGEALIQTGHDRLALERLSAYIDANGPEATHYQRALTLISDGESDSDADAIWQRDSTLSAETRKDKYLLALSQTLESQRYDRALVYFDLIERLQVDRPAGFDFYQGEALLRTGDAERATQKLFDYIRAAGSKGQHYTRALELVNEAEQM